MPKYVIEREIPGAGKLSAKELKAMSQTSCGVLQKMGPQTQWVHSYVRDNKIYCVYVDPARPQPARVSARGAPQGARAVAVQRPAGLSVPAAGGVLLSRRGAVAADGGAARPGAAGVGRGREQCDRQRLEHVQH